MDDVWMILRQVEPGVDDINCEELIDGRVLDSFSVLELIGRLEDYFEIRISPGEVTAAKFNSVRSIWDMVQRLKQGE